MFQRAFVVALLLVATAHAFAQTPLQDTARAFVLREAALAAGGQQSRIDVVIGAPDSRLSLAPCARIEPFVPAGQRLWGRAMVGVRCASGATWSVMLPVTVRISGPALVAARPLAPGAAVGTSDVNVAEAEWTREPMGVVVDARQLENRVLTRPINTGQPIALTALRAPQAVGQGEVVRLVGRGQNFSITTDGIALAAAADGQPVRVRTESGRIVSGTARAGRIVEVSF